MSGPNSKLGWAIAVLGVVLAACHQGNAPPAGVFTGDQLPIPMDCDVTRKETTPEGEVKASSLDERFELSQQSRSGVIGVDKAWINTNDLDGPEGASGPQTVWVLNRVEKEELVERRVHHTLWDGQVINEYTKIDVSPEFIKVLNSIGYPHDKKGRERDSLVISRVDGSLVEAWHIASPDGTATYEDHGTCYPPGKKPPKPVKAEGAELSKASREQAKESDESGAEASAPKAEPSEAAKPPAEAKPHAHE